MAHLDQLFSFIRDMPSSSHEPILLYLKDKLLKNCIGNKTHFTSNFKNDIIESLGGFLFVGIIKQYLIVWVE